MTNVIQFVVVLIISMLHISYGVTDNDFDPSLLVLMQDIVDAIFPRNCAAEETWKNEQTTGKQVHCIFQKGHWGEELAQFADDAESLGCNVDKGMAKYMADNFGSSAYINNPIYQRLGEDCGVCGRKASCCGVIKAQDMLKRLSKDHPEIEGVDPFYFQSIKGLPCSDTSTRACSYNPLSPAEFDILANLQKNFTKNIDRSDDCNFAQFGYTEWEASRTSSLFPVAAPIYNKFLCRSLQTNRPRVNCVKDATTKKCMCCCQNYFPERSGSDWTCVSKNELESESICSSV